MFEDDFHCAMLNAVFWIAIGKGLSCKILTQEESSKDCTDASLGTQYCGTPVVAKNYFSCSALMPV